VHGEGSWSSRWFRGLVTSMSSGVFKQFVSPTLPSKWPLSLFSNRNQKKVVGVIDGWMDGWTCKMEDVSPFINFYEQGIRFMSYLYKIPKSYL